MSVWIVQARFGACAFGTWNWFAPEGVERADQYSYRRSNWFPHVGNEVMVCGNALGCWSCRFAKYELEARCARFLERVLAGVVPKKIVLCV